MLHHRSNDVPNLENVKGVRLSHPIKYVAENSTSAISQNSNKGIVKGPPRTPPYTGQNSKGNVANPSSIVVRAGATTSKNGSSTPGNRVIRPQPKTELDQRRNMMIKQSSEEIPLPVRSSKGKFLKKTKSAEQMLGDKKPSGGLFSKFRRKLSSDDLLPKDISDKKDTPRSKSDDAEERPPMPLPRDPAKSPRDTSSGTLSTVYQYDVVREAEEDLLPELMERLTKNCSTSKCDCGLYFDESELPGGWSVHLSKDSRTLGKLFFMGPEGETAWNLPLEVSVELSPKQQDKIRELLHKHKGLAWDPHVPRSHGSAGSSADSNPSLPPAGPEDAKAHQGAAFPGEENDDVFL